jgi:hypothetical protein
VRFIIAPLRKADAAAEIAGASEGGGERSAPPPATQPDKAPVSDWDAYQQRLSDEKVAAEEKKADEAREQRERSERAKEKAADDYQARRT